MKHMSKLVATGVAAVALMGSSGATSAGADGAPADGGHWGRRVTWTSHNPPIAITAPVCDSGGHCAYPFTGTGKVEGGLIGTYVSAGGAATDTTGARFAVGRTELFVGTVVGCGTGTMVLYVTEDATATSATTTWRIANGYGSGDLTKVSGEGSGSITGQDEDGVIWSLRGQLRCER